MSLIDVRGLRIKTLPDRKATAPLSIVRGLDLSIKPGSIFGLAGESGCGKSMTALALMGILPKGMAAEGSVSFEGKDLLKLSESELRSIRGSRMAMVFQEPMTSLNPVLRIGYQIAEVLTTHMNISNAEAEKRVIELMQSVRIPSPEIRMREYPHQMSGGMRQRVMIAMAIACGPALLIADEPTTALDVTIEAQVLELIRTLRDERKMGVLLITHDLGVLAENAETVGIMYAGALMELAPAAALYSQPSHPYTIGLMRSLPSVRGKRLIPIPGVVPKPGQLPKGCAFSDRCAYTIPGCREQEPELMPLASNPEHLTRCIRASEGELPWKS